MQVFGTHPRLAGFSLGAPAPPPKGAPMCPEFYHDMNGQECWQDRSTQSVHEGDYGGFSQT
eukprot:8830503-Pyramimonas_sp.AAC.1